MMQKTVFVVAIAVACMYTLDASPPTSKQLNVRALLNAKKDLSAKNGQLVNGKMDKDADFLCAPCKQFFSVLKDLIGDVDEMTKKSLGDALNLTCKYLEGTIPFIDQVCDEFGPTFIDLLYKYIKEVDEEIEPDHDCKLLFMCWGDDKSQKAAFQNMIQKMIVDNKIHLN